MANEQNTKDIPIPGVTDKKYKLSDGAVHLIRIGITTPTPNSLYALTREVEAARAKGVREDV